MILSFDNLSRIRTAEGLELPDKSSAALPEKVLQFGTGVLLRALPDYFIDQANKKGYFNGRVVVVKSTGKPGTEFSDQDNLYTTCVRGIHNGAKVERYVVNAAISRVISAQDEWQQVLACAANEHITIVISNTTEVGITLHEQDIVDGSVVPESFPGKLTACLYHRYKTFAGAAGTGWSILPTELITDNGSKLQAICCQLARLNNLPEAFIEWLETHNDFCNTLVDCIVPGTLPQQEAKETQQQLGYTDQLMIMSEPYRLWAIESSNPETIARLTFADAAAGLIIAPDIHKFRDLKLRILNGAHTFSCGLALLSGFSTVKEAMQNAFFEQYLSELMLQEIAPTLFNNNLQEAEAHSFAEAVLDRFRNPHIDHRWESISKQYSAKMLLRNIPTLQAYYRLHKTLPEQMVLGLAAYMYFMRSVPTNTGSFTRNCLGKTISIDDSQAATLQQHWQQGNQQEAIHRILADTALWHTDLTALPGLEEAVNKQIDKLKATTSISRNSAIV